MVTEEIVTEAIVTEPMDSLNEAVLEASNFDTNFETNFESEVRYCNNYNISAVEEYLRDFILQHVPMEFQFADQSCENIQNSNKPIVFQNVGKKSSEFELSEFLLDLNSKIVTMDLKQKDTALVYGMLLNLLRCFKDTNKKWIAEDDGKTDAVQILDLTYDIAYHSLASFRKVYSRKKMLFSNANFVKPVEKAIGTRFELKKMRFQNRIIHVPRQLQCSLQYVPILKTIQSLFSCEEFASLYFGYNDKMNPNAIGWDGSKKYSNFSSGSCYAQNELFQSYPNSLQLQISVDDFEPCNALQSKSGRHKVCAVYFSIHNLPEKFAAKLNNIHLICLCNSDDIKSKHTDFNNIWQLIVDEISVLETDGIIVDGKTLRGKLVQTAFDNLGANVSLGFSGSFSSHKYCRHCLSSKSECQNFTSESECTLRTIENYQQSLNIVDESESVNLNETDGVKFYCVLSSLHYYHIVENPTADVMHDICEGCIPELLTHFFKFCFKQKIFSADELDNMVKCFDYGILNHANVPSDINFNKKNLGQNAAQALCLLRNLPLILNKYRNHQKLNTAWKCVTSLLQICEIVSSYEITELEIRRLEVTIALHLTLFKETFGVNLIPKMHFLLHYGGIIRKVGPLRHFNMMRYDAKHRTFKKFRNSTNNFKNINKTLAEKHQQMMYLNGFTYKDKVEHGVLKTLENTNMFNLFCSLNEFPSTIYQTKFVIVNSYRYSKGLLVVHAGAFFEIVHIIYAMEIFYLACFPCVIDEFDSFLNSFKIQRYEETNSLTIIKLSELVYTKSYEIKAIADSNYVISDTLDLRANIKR